MEPNSTTHGADGKYVTDVPYARHFAHQLAPTMLRLVSALNGVTPPVGEDFTYCEIGSGVGDSLVTLAAANRAAQFVGIDVNPAHVALARGLAEQAGLTNVQFFERDFASISPGELPPFDFIGAHGFMSWVGPAVRAAAIEFARVNLKPAGLFYASYNALPGWAAIEPLRRLILDRGAVSAGGSLDRAREGCRFAQRLADAGAGYFANHPTARSMLALIETAGLPYVVHEYMNAHWEPMYFADVERAMAGAGLSFVGQMPLHLNLPDLAIPPALKDLAKTVTERSALQTFKDFAVNELFRSDVYANASLARAEKTTRDYFQEAPFGTVAPGPQVRRTVKLPHYTLDFAGPIYESVIGAISSGAQSARDLATRSEFASLGVKRLGDLLMNLCLGGDVLPMRPTAPTVPPASAPSTLYRIPLGFNRAVLEEVSPERPRVLASPITGTGLTVSLLEILCLQLVTSVEPARYASFIRAFSHRAKAPVMVGTRSISDPAELVRVILRELELFRARSLPKLIELGVVESAAAEPTLHATG